MALQGRIIDFEKREKKKKKGTQLLTVPNGRACILGLQVTRCFTLHTFIHCFAGLDMEYMKTTKCKLRKTIFS